MRYFSLTLFILLFTQGYSQDVQQVEIIQKVLIEKYPEIWTEIRDDVAEMLT